MQDWERLIRWLPYAALALAGSLFVAVVAVNATTSRIAAPLSFSASTTASTGSIRVHVAGEVARPDVYELGAGSRVAEAIEAAGGATASADLDALNLARHLRDGERVTVPPQSPRGTAQSEALAGKLVNINTASKSQLEALPGIGEAYAIRIIDSRAVDGLFTSVEELVSRKVVPAATLEKIRQYITASN